MLFYVIQALNYFQTIQSDKAGFLAANVNRYSSSIASGVYREYTYIYAYIYI